MQIWKSKICETGRSADCVTPQASPAVGAISSCNRDYRTHRSILPISNITGHFSIVFTSTTWIALIMGATILGGIWMAKNKRKKWKEKCLCDVGHLRNQGLLSYVKYTSNLCTAKKMSPRHRMLSKFATTSFHPKCDSWELRLPLFWQKRKDFHELTFEIGRTKQKEIVCFYYQGISLYTIQTTIFPRKKHGIFF
jgi:hypothetical protein